MADLVELTDFIVSLCEDPEKARRFREDPKAVIEEAEISGRTKSLLGAGPEAVRREAAADFALANTITTVHTHTHTHVQTNTVTQTITVTR